MSNGDEHVNRNRNTDFDESLLDDSLLSQYRAVEDEITVILNNRDPNDKSTALDKVKELNELTKQLNNTLASHGIAEIIKPAYTERSVTEIFVGPYRDKQESSESLEEAELDKNSSESTPIIKKNTRFQLRPPIFNPNTQFSTSTPIITVQKGSLNPSKLSDIKEEKFEQIKSQIKQSLEETIKQEIVDSYFAGEGEEKLNESIKKGFYAEDIINFFKNRISVFIGEQNQGINRIKKQEVDTSNDQTNYISALEGGNDTLNTTMGTQVRGLSLKDALDLIPRFNGQNVTLSQFLDGCNEAKSILPNNLEGELAKLIRMRLYGEALSSARGQTFNTIDEIIQYFEKIFGSGKTYHDWTGELAKTKQKPNETVISYINRLREIEQEILKAAKYEKRTTEGDNFNTELEKDCLKFFLRGLKWEIRARVGSPENFKTAKELALEIEKEFACSILENEEKSNTREKNVRDTRRVHMLENEPEKLICAYCKRTGHGAINCLTFARSQMDRNYRTFQGNTNNRNNFQRYNFYTRENLNNPRFNNSNYNNQNRQNFGGWNAENRGRVAFLPPQNNSNFSNNNRNGYNNPNNNINNGNIRNLGGPIPTTNTTNRDFSNQRRSNNATSIECFYCGRQGHVQRDCFQYQRDSRGNGPNTGNGPALSLTGAQGEADPKMRPPAAKAGGSQESRT